MTRASLTGIPLALLLTVLSCKQSPQKQAPTPGPDNRNALRPDAPRRRATPPPRVPPRPRSQARPAAVGNNVLELPDAPGVTPLTVAQAQKLPYVQVEVARVVAAARKHCAEHWYGLYLQGKKLGFARMGCRLRRWKGRPALERTSLMVMQAQLYTTAVRLESKTRAVFDAEGTGELLRYEYSVDGAQQQKSLVVTRQADGWHVLRSYRAGAIRKPPERTVIKTLKAALTNGETAVSTLLVEGKLSPGQRYRYVEFDPEKARDQDAAAQLLATGVRALRGVKIKLYKLEMLEMHRRLRGVTVLDASANWLDGLLQGTIRIRREEKATAKTVDPKAGDFGLGAVIKARLAVKKVGRVKGLRLRLNGFLPAALAETARHKLVKKGARAAELTITREAVPTPASMTLPVTDKQYAKELAATHQIESKHPELRALAKRAVGRETNALAAARKLNRFVFDYLRKSLSTNLDSALAIARARAGDCTEHARLMVALCRAIGLPAREVGGVTYVPDLGGFGYHAWVEVWVGRWITADPSWDELPANATHIQMGSPEDVQWIGTLGSLRLEVLGFETD